MRRLTIFVIVGITLCYGVSAKAADPISADLAARIQPLIDAHKGDVGVAIKNLSGDGQFSFRQDQPMATASLIKLPLMVATYQQIDAGKFDPAQLIELKQADQVPGSGILSKDFSAGLRLSLFDAIRLMIKYSDNTATNLVVDQLGLRATAESMQALGLLHTKLHSKVYRRDTSIFPERSKRFGLGSTSASDMVVLLELLHRKRIASEESCDAMISHLLTCDDTVKMSAGLPKGTKIAHKTGAVSRVRTDAGIIYGPGPDDTFAICVLTENNKDQSWAAKSTPHVLIASIAREAYRAFYGDKTPATQSPAKKLKLGAFGHLVESLQRTLNARLSPSPSLSVDGDYGAMTQTAVMRFQESKQLKPTGSVDQQTFAALGTLIDRDAPVAAPKTLNSNWPERKPADALEGVPFVTAKAWVIVDAETSHMVAGFEQDQSRPMASTTKLMTAMLVSELADHDPSIWEQTITFSQRADHTGGSTAGIRVGESLSAGELMYGLMLPSGNDASVAFAQHFGAQVELLDKAFPDTEWSGETNAGRFIQAMNLLGQRIGMKNSKFVNPHGLPASGHQASASDLADLAIAAMKRPLLQKIVSTPQYGTTVTGPGGYRRNLAWYNSNHLLKIDGYQGVKTGTTASAGACLIAQGTRGKQTRFVVILGSSSSDARYADTRNLFRWGWNQHP